MNENADLSSAEMLILRRFDNGQNTADIAKSWRSEGFNEAAIDRMLSRALEKRRVKGKSN